MNKGFITTATLLNILLVLSFVMGSEFFTQEQKEQIKESISIMLFEQNEPIIENAITKLEERESQNIGTPMQNEPTPMQIEDIRLEKEQEEAIKKADKDRRQSEIPECGEVNAKELGFQEFSLLTLEQLCTKGNLFMHNQEPNAKWYTWGCFGTRTVTCGVKAK